MTLKGNQEEQVRKAGRAVLDEYIFIAARGVLVQESSELSWSYRRVVLSMIWQAQLCESTHSTSL
jgi:hypothetical protein